MIWLCLNKKKWRKSGQLKTYDWLINYIPDPITKTSGGFKDKVIGLLKIITPEKSVYGMRKTS